MLASSRAQRGKRRYKAVIEWNNNLEYNILNLHESLRTGSYRVSEYTRFTIHEPKKREISRLPFRDRVVHHAVLNHIEPILRRNFISQTYACIRGRGIHKALRDLNKSLRLKEDTMYCLKMDIKKFYPSVDNTIMKSMLRRKFKDEQFLNLLNIIIDSCQGLPLGNYTSQWLANFYLSGFDHWMKEVNGVKHYFRYCDDMVVLGSDKRALHHLRRDVSQYLRLINLELSNYQVFPVGSRGIDFLGYKSYHSHILLRKSIKQRFKRMTRDNYNIQSVYSYYGWIKHCNGINLTRKYTNLVID
jgi:RNA-directed DNA polymerase